MKLVELLAQELDVWPHNAVTITQDDDAALNLYRIGNPTATTDGGCVWRGTGFNGYLTKPDVLADDYQTAIITRADWQAERERIAGGWIAWGGGECPVAGGALIDTRHRDGQERLHTSCGQYGTRTHQMFWDHCGDGAEVIAYRLHKPEQQQPQQEREEMTPCEKLGYKVGDLFVMTESSCFQRGDEIRLIRDDESDCPKLEAVNGGTQRYESLIFVRKITDKPAVAVNIETQGTDDPRAMRDRILEIDRTTEALEGERGQLVQRLADEGFVLARVDGKVEPVEDMSDWRNWKAGDSVEVISDDDDESGHKKGAILKINEV